MYVCGLFLGELKQQLLKDLNWRRPTEIEGIEIGPLTFKVDNKNKKGDDSKRKQVIFLLDSEVFAHSLNLQTPHKNTGLVRQFRRKSQNSNVN